MVLCSNDYYQRNCGCFSSNIKYAIICSTCFICYGVLTEFFDDFRDLEVDFFVVKQGTANDNFFMIKMIIIDYEWIFSMKNLMLRVPDVLFDSIDASFRRSVDGTGSRQSQNVNDELAAVGSVEI